jgi:hypothetical protein
VLRKLVVRIVNIDMDAKEIGCEGGRIVNIKMDAE